MFEALRYARWTADAERLGGGGGGDGGGGELGVEGDGGVEGEGEDGAWDDGPVDGLVTLTEEVPARLLDLSQSAMPSDALSTKSVPTNCQKWTRVWKRRAMRTPLQVRDPHNLMESR